MNAPGTPQWKLDAAAVGCSSACAIHCLALPLLAALLPVLEPIAANEAIHRIFVLIAIPISFMAIFRPSPGNRRWLITTLIATGLTLMVAAAFLESLHDYETALTLLGASILSAGHIIRFNQGRQTTRHHAH